MKSEEYYRVASDTPTEGFTAKECYKVTEDTVSESFIAEEYYKITKGPERSDPLEDLDQAPEVEGTSRVREQKVVRKVYSYFFKSIFSDRNLSPRREVLLAPVSPHRSLVADVVLFSLSESPIAIAECKGSDGANHGRRQLWSYLCASNTRFGVFANSLNPDDWVFYENLRHSRFRKIKRDRFEQEVAAGNYSIEARRSWTGDIWEDLNRETSNFEGLSEDSVYYSFAQEDEMKTDFEGLSEDSVYYSFAQEDEMEPHRVKSEIEDYLSEFISQSWEYSQKKNCKIQIGSEDEPRTADFVLRGRDDSFIIIADCTFNIEVNGSILYTLLRGTDTQFGIIARSTNRDNWQFYENLGGSISILERSAFKEKVNAQVKEAACSVFKGEILPKKKWDQCRETWKLLEAERIWRVTKVFHPDCPFKVGELLSDFKYRQARQTYPGCSVKKNDIITEAKLAELRRTWPDLKVEKRWRVTKVYHPECPFEDGRALSDVEYIQALKKYPGCSIKKDEVLTKTEWEQFLKEAWPNVNIERGSWISEAGHQQLEDERRRYRSMVRRWQLAAAVAVFLLLFIPLGIFLTHRNKDADHQNAINELTREAGEKESKIQGLNFELQTLSNENAALKKQNSELQKQLKDKNFSIPPPKKVENLEEKISGLQHLLTEKEGENQKLQHLLTEKDAKIQQLEKRIGNQDAEIQRLKEKIKLPGNGEDPPENPPSPANEIIVYVTGSGTKYHKEGCSSIKRSSSKREISLAEAKQEKKEPCSKCDPPE